MGEICEVCGRPKCSATGGPCEWDGRECHGGVDCYSRGYERSQEALAAARRECDGLRDALRECVRVVDAAGLLNLSNGVQLGQTSWFVKASDAFDGARAALATGGEGK